MGGPPPRSVLTSRRPRSPVDWAVVLVVGLVAAAVAGILLLPRRRQWNADGEADRTRESLEEDE